MDIKDLNEEQIIQLLKYIQWLEEQNKDMKSIITMLETQKASANKKLKDIQNSIEPIIDITYEDGDRD